MIRIGKTSTKAFTNHNDSIHVANRPILKNSANNPHDPKTNRHPKTIDYDLFIAATENSSRIPTQWVIITDDIFLSPKLTLKTLSFLSDEDTLYGVQALYENEHRQEVKGYKIMPKIKPKSAVSKSLVIDEGEVISCVEVGVDGR
jgi:hypothetical protein